MRNFCASLLLLVFATACSGVRTSWEDFEEVKREPVIEAPPVTMDSSVAHDAATIGQGRYMVELLGCPACHANGALIGEPDFDRWLIGSDVGIAYSNPLEFDEPGVVFPSNLTPDPETGIGRLTDDELVGAIKQGYSSHGRRPIFAMPWLAYSELSDDDTAAIIAYLRNLPPIKHAVPERVPPGVATDERFVYFGIYRRR